MADSTVKNYGDIDYNIREIKRYMSCKSDYNGVDNVIDECLAECGERLVRRVCYGIYDITVNDDETDFGFAKLKSKNLAKNIISCNKAIVFCATVGTDIDRLIRLYGKTDMLKSLCFDAIGTDAVENLCNRFDEEITGSFQLKRPRFSPGYGDLPLAFQRDIFSELNCTRKIGVSLNDSLLMIPTKSVTAIIGGCII